MVAIIRWLVPAVAAAYPLAASAQQSDAAYCQALARKYEALVVNMNGHSNEPGPLDARFAVEQCQTGGAAAAIPVLEHKLNDARVELPKRS